MKYLHIMPPSKRMMIGFLTMLQKDFDMGDHKVIFESALGMADSGLLLFPNTVDFPALGKGKIRKFLALRKAFREADRIVFHCFSPNWQWLIFLFVQQHFLDKAVWVMWGVDLYNYKRPGKGLFVRLFNYMGRKCRERMRYPVAISEIDIPVYQKMFGTHKPLCAPYGFTPERFWQLDEILRKQQEEKEKLLQDPAEEAAVATDAEDVAAVTDTEEVTAAIDAEDVAAVTDAEEMETPRIRVQIGHNAFPFNNHVPALDMLERFQYGENRDDFELILPVSYGNQIITGKIDYRTALANYARIKFPGKITLWTKMVDNNSYTKRLATIDIGIFNSARQNGIGNLLQLLYMGKKIYLSAQNPLFSMLRRKGFEIHDVQELKTISFEEFVKPVQVPFPNPWVKECYSVAACSKIWKVIFPYVEGKTTYEEAFAENQKLL